MKTLSAVALMLFAVSAQAQQIGVSIHTYRALEQGPPNRCWLVALYWVMPHDAEPWADNSAEDPLGVPTWSAGNKPVHGVAECSAPVKPTGDKGACAYIDGIPGRQYLVTATAPRGEWNRARVWFPKNGGCRILP